MNRILTKFNSCLLTLALFFFLLPTNALSNSSAWISTTSLPYILASHTIATYQEKIFIINGSAAMGQSKSNVLSADLNNNGTLSNWVTNSTTPTSLIWHVSTQKGNFIYTLGGKEENPGSAMSHVNKVFIGTINSSGQVTAWQASVGLPKPLSLGTAQVVGNRLYYIGGFREQGGSIISSNVYYANILSDGTLSAWTTVTSIPQPLYGLMSTTNGNSITIFGGRTNSGYSNKTYHATINPDGTITQWTESAPLPEPIDRAGIAQVGSKIMLFGGNPTPTASKIYIADIASNGSVSNWTLSDITLPQPTCCGAVTTVGDYIYLIAGHNSSNGDYYNSVYYINSAEILGSSFPFFSQNDPGWGQNEYDHAASLGFSNSKFERWGCAVTSAAMILQYHEIKEFSNGNEINPGTLNEWLKNNNGYLTGKTPTGSYSYISWPAISRLTKELYDAGKASIKLEHQRHYPSNSTTQQLNSDLTSLNIPNILYVSNSDTTGHFVVATQINNGIYSIKDPEWNYPNLSSFNNQYMQVDRFVPSQTDLSYIILVVNPEIEILVTDPQGRKTGKSIVNKAIKTFNQIPTASYAFEKPISNPNDQNNSENLGTGVNVFLLPKPINGIYRVMLTTKVTNNYALNISLYDNEGSNITNELNGIIKTGSTELYQTSFTDSSPSTPQTITIKTTIADIYHARQVQQIKSSKTVEKLLDFILDAENDLKEGDKKDAKKKFESFEKTLTQEKNKTIFEPAYTILLEDILYLKSKL